MANNSPSFGPHASHSNVIPTARRLHQRRPHVNLKEYDAQVLTGDGLRAALVNQKAANDRLAIDPESAEFQKGVALANIEVEQATSMARIMRVANVDALLAEYAPAAKPAKKAAGKAATAPAPSTPGTGQSAPGTTTAPTGAPVVTDPTTVEVRVTADMAAMLAGAEGNPALKATLQAVLTEDLPDAVKMAKMKGIVSKATT